MSVERLSEILDPDQKKLHKLKPLGSKSTRYSKWVYCKRL